jgi:(p)ppGpp synthase/HD superfamily hydrolase
MSQLYKALKFAEKAHAGQMRKYGNRPYILHPIEVMTKVFGVYQHLQEKNDDVLCAALLHDTVEDCGVTEEQLTELFGKNVSSLVMELTQPDKISEEIHKLPRKERHRLLLEKLTKISSPAKILKMCDRWANLRDSNILDKECYGFFKRRYLQESWDIANLLYPAYPSLGDELKEVIQNLARQVGIELK